MKNAKQKFLMTAINCQWVGIRRILQRTTLPHSPLPSGDKKWPVPWLKLKQQNENEAQCQQEDIGDKKETEKNSQRVGQKKPIPI